MKFGLRYANTGPWGQGPAAVEIAQAAEEAGFESIWTVEHVVIPRGYESRYPYNPSGRMGEGLEDFPLPDPIIWMTYVAANTSRIKVATGVLILPQRNPLVTAKALATLDDMAGGDRVLLGVGVGWLEEEFNALGVPFAERGPRTDDYIEAMRTLWREDAPSYDGPFVSFPTLSCKPQPAHGRIPIHIGGHTNAAARRAGRLGDGYFPARGNPVEQFDLVRRSAEEAGRDPDAIERTVQVPESMSEIEALAADGVDRVLVPLTPAAGLPALVNNPDEVLEYGRRVIAEFS